MHVHSACALRPAVPAQHVLGDRVLEVFLADSRRENTLANVFGVVHHVLEIGGPQQVNFGIGVCLQVRVA